MAQVIFPHLVQENCAAALDWYVEALGAKELMRMPTPDGRMMHAAIELYGERVLMNDDFPEMSPNKTSLTPKARGGSAVTIHIQVPDDVDVDAVWKRAMDAGGIVMMPLGDQFWGDRYGMFFDPFGHRWSVGKTIRKMTPDEQMEAGKNFKM